MPLDVGTQYTGKSIANNGVSINCNQARAHIALGKYSHYCTQTCFSIYFIYF